MLRELPLATIEFITYRSPYGRFAELWTTRAIPLGAAQSELQRAELRTCDDVGEDTLEMSREEVLS